MSAYMLFETEEWDSSWREAYGPPTRALLEKYGGKVIAACREGERMEGESQGADGHHPDRVSRQGGSEGVAFRPGVPTADRAAPDRIESRDPAVQRLVIAGRASKTIRLHHPREGQMITAIVQFKLPDGTTLR